MSDYAREMANKLVDRIDELESELVHMYAHVDGALYKSSDDPFMGVSLRSTIEYDIQSQRARIAWANAELIRYWKLLGEATYQDYQSAMAEYRQLLRDKL